MVHMEIYMVHIVELNMASTELYMVQAITGMGRFKSLKLNRNTFSFLYEGFAGMSSLQWHI